MENYLCRACEYFSEFVAWKLPDSATNSQEGSDVLLKVTAEAVTKAASLYDVGI